MFAEPHDHPILAAMKHDRCEDMPPRACRVSELTTTAAGQTIVKLDFPQGALSWTCRS